METVHRFFKIEEPSVFVFGPRGTGKSTWLRILFKDALWIDLLDPERVRFLSAAPERLRELVEARKRPATVVIDEVQRLPELLPVVHALIEERRGDRFFLTGSSSRKLKQTGADLLAGRAVLKTMHPFMAAELGARFDMNAALREGLLPLAVSAPNSSAVLRTYAALYMKEEVQAEGLVRNIGAFARFLEAISFSHSAELSVSNVARECGVERKTVEGYVGILEDLLLAWRLPVFTRRASRALTAHPKFYIFDAGVFRSLRPQGPLDRAEEMAGQALEGLVAQHLRAWCEYGGIARSLHFWRTRGGLEVDFVVYGAEGLFALEVKNARQVHDADLKSLRAFGADYPESQRCLLHRGKDALVRHGILCLPVERFLKQLKPGGPLWDF
jgi:uncharacterized protein